jgi:GNAT superfamily N-acetyltransferase
MRIAGRMWRSLYWKSSSAPTAFEQAPASHGSISLDGEGTHLGEVADEIAAGDYEVSFVGGRVFYFQQVYVHPEFRGQRLAARLMAHAPWRLATDYSDVVLLEARPIVCRYTDAEPVCTPGTVGRLVRYCERVGFKRWTPDVPITSSHVEMYFLGTHRLPFMTDAIDPQSVERDQPTIQGHSCAPVSPGRRRRGRALDRDDRLRRLGRAVCSARYGVHGDHDPRGTRYGESMIEPGRKRGRE